MKRITFYIIAVLAAMLTSCSDTSYLNAIPQESTLLISMNTAKLSGAGSPVLLKSLLQNSE